MGGYGSGQYQRYNAKSTVEECITLNLFKLTQEGSIRPDAVCSGMFTAGTSRMGFTLKNNVITLSYTFTAGVNKGRDVTYNIHLSRTYPNFGGERLWLHCPNCKRRAGKLYLAPGQLYYLCRVCADLTYQSTRELTLRKAMERVYAHERRVANLCAKYGIPWPANGTKL